MLLKASPDAKNVQALQAVLKRGALVEGRVIASLDIESDV